MSKPPDLAAIMRELSGLRKQVAQQGTDLKALLKARDDHERRLVAVESVKAQMRSLVDCNQAILRHVAEIRDEQDAAHKIVARNVETAMRGEHLETRRVLRGDVMRLAKALSSRPCIRQDDGECPLLTEEKKA